MHFHRRIRRLTTAVLVAGMCFQLGTCANELSLTPVRIAFSSFTLPFNQYLAGFFNLISLTIAQAVASAS